MGDLTDAEKDYLNYLEELRESSRINMFEAPNELVIAFGIELDEARRVFALWRHERKQLPQ